MRSSLVADLVLLSIAALLGGGGCSRGGSAPPAEEPGEVPDIGPADVSRDGASRPARTGMAIGACVARRPVAGPTVGSAPMLPAAALHRCAASPPPAGLVAAQAALDRCVVSAVGVAPTVGGRLLVHVGAGAPRVDGAATDAALARCVADALASTPIGSASSPAAPASSPAAPASSPAAPASTTTNEAAGAVVCTLRVENPAARPGGGPATVASLDATALRLGGEAEEVANLASGASWLVTRLVESGSATALERLVVDATPDAPAPPVGAVVRALGDHPAALQLVVGGGPPIDVPGWARACAEHDAPRLVLGPTAAIVLGGQRRPVARGKLAVALAELHRTVGGRVDLVLEIGARARVVNIAYAFEAARAAGFVDVDLGP